jgi:hypothetical protein
MVYVVVPGSFALPIFVEYFRGRRYIDVDINDQGISAIWFYTKKPSWAFHKGKRIKESISWADIVRFEHRPSGMYTWWESFFIETKDRKRFYWILFLKGFRTPKAFKDMKVDFEDHYEKWKKTQTLG